MCLAQGRRNRNSVSSGLCVVPMEPSFYTPCCLWRFYEVLDEPSLVLCSHCRGGGTSPRIPTGLMSVGAGKDKK